LSEDFFKILTYQLLEVFMHKGDRIFVDGMSTVKMTNGVVLMDFYNNRNNGGADIQESCGEIVMSQQAFLQAYSAMDDLLKKMIDAGLVRRNSGDNNASAPAQQLAEAASPNFE